MAFHVKDGLYFDKLEKGDVKITKRADEKPDSEIIFEQIVDANTWRTLLVMFKFVEDQRVEGDTIDRSLPASRFKPRENT